MAKDKTNNSNENESSENAVRSEEHKYPMHHVLSLTNRGITGSHSQLKHEIDMLLTHSKSDSKFDCSLPPKEIASVARQRKCDIIMYWETRHHRDLTLWLSAYPSGPTVLFHISNIKTADQLNFLGNLRRFTRPVLSFDSSFDADILSLDVRIVKEMLKKTFSTPNMHPKSAPFIDHVIQFTKVNAHASNESKDVLAKPDLSYKSSAGFEKTMNSLEIEFRCYEISYDPHRKVTENIVLTEAGPRFTLTPIKILDACMFGNTIWRNATFVTMTERLKFKKILEKKEMVHNAACMKRAREMDKSLPVDQIDTLFEDRAYFNKTILVNPETPYIGIKDRKTKLAQDEKDAKENPALNEFDEEEIEEFDEEEDLEDEEELNEDYDEYDDENESED